MMTVTSALLAFVLFAAIHIKFVTKCTQVSKHIYECNTGWHKWIGWLLNSYLNVNVEDIGSKKVKKYKVTVKIYYKKFWVTSQYVISLMGLYSLHQQSPCQSGVEGYLKGSSIPIDNSWMGIAERHEPTPKKEIIQWTSFFKINLTIFFIKFSL